VLEWRIAFWKKADWSVRSNPTQFKIWKHSSGESWNEPSLEVFMEERWAAPSQNALECNSVPLCPKGRGLGDFLYWHTHKLKANTLSIPTMNFQLAPSRVNPTENTGLWTEFCYWWGREGGKKKKKKPKKTKNTPVWMTTSLKVSPLIWLPLPWRSVKGSAVTRAFSTCSGHINSPSVASPNFRAKNNTISSFLTWKSFLTNYSGIRCLHLIKLTSWEQQERGPLLMIKTPRISNKACIDVLTKEELKLIYIVAHVLKELFHCCSVHSWTTFS